MLLYNRRYTVDDIISSLSTITFAIIIIAYDQIDGISVQFIFNIKGSVDTWEDLTTRTG